MAADGRRHVIAIGGGMRVPDGQVPAHMDYALRLAGRPEPRICVLNTAGGDDPRWALHMYDRFAGHPARLSHLALFPMPNVADPEDLLLSHRLIADGTLAGGIACDDGAAAHFTDDTLTELIADRPGASAYRVEPGIAETRLETRFLGSTLG